MSHLISFIDEKHRRRDLTAQEMCEQRDYQNHLIGCIHGEVETNILFKLHRFIIQGEVRSQKDEVWVPCSYEDWVYEMQQYNYTLDQIKLAIYLLHRSRLIKIRTDETLTGTINSYTINYNRTAGWLNSPYYTMIRARLCKRRTR